MKDEKTLVKSLHSGDPDVIQTCGLQFPDYSGVNDLQVGCAYLQLFIILFKANPSEYGSYLLHIRMFRYIHKHIYSHHSFLICLQILHLIYILHLKYMSKQIFASERMFSLHFLILANICFEICVLKQIFAKLKADFTFKRIFTCKYCRYQ